MTTCKLTYFNLRARAEVPRLILALAGVEYEDYRIPREDWPALKPKTPFGQMPILEIDGAVFCQSLAISRYLAKKYGLAGKNDVESTTIDMLVDCCEDMNKPLRPIVVETDEAKKAELKKKFLEDHLPNFLAGFEKALKSNNGGDGYFVGNNITWADLCFLHYIETVSLRTEKAIDWDKAPKLKALLAKVEANARIAAWIKKRPATPH